MSLKSQVSSDGYLIFKLEARASTPAFVDNKIHEVGCVTLLSRYILKCFKIYSNKFQLVWKFFGLYNVTKVSKYISTSDFTPWLKWQPRLRMWSNSEITRIDQNIWSGYTPTVGHPYLIGMDRLSTTSVSGQFWHKHKKYVCVKLTTESCVSCTWTVFVQSSTPVVCNEKTKI